MQRIYWTIACLLLAGALAPAIVLAETAETPKKAPASKTPAAKAPARKTPAATPAKGTGDATKGDAAKAPATTPSALTGKAGTPGMPVEKAPAKSTEPAGQGPEAAAPGEAAEAFKPYTGVISTDIVNVRSGPGLYYYPLVVVQQGTPVSVEQRVGDWVALKPLEGTFGLMKKSDLEIAADNASATVSAASARVYAGGQSAKRDWCVMKTLLKGDKVKVLGMAGDDKVEVAPPDGCCVYVLASYVTQGKGPAVTTKEPRYPILDTEVKPEEKDPEVDEFKAAEAALVEELKKPVAERHYQPLYDRYKDIAEQASKPYLKRNGAARAQYLQRLIQLQEDYLKVLKLGDDLNKNLSDMALKHSTAVGEAEIKRASTKPPFLATGVVEPLLSVEGVETPIARFKLVDVKGKPVVLVKSSSVNLEDYAGKAVGVRGTKAFVKEWNIYLVTVDEVELLE
jgi:uncharacterized protein YgiM (DUF1202 family)